MDDVARAANVTTKTVSKLNSLDDVARTANVTTKTVEKLNGLDDIARGADIATDTLNSTSKIDDIVKIVDDPINYADDAANVVDDAINGTGKANSITSKDIIFGSDTKSAQKLSNQMSNRGWTKELVENIVDDSYTTRVSINKATGNSATVFYTKQGSYVIVDDVTKSIVQVSDNINPSTWVPDMSIIDPYILK